MAEISGSVVKVDHGPKVRGEARFVADYPMEGILYGKTLRSDRARAKIQAINVPELPMGYVVADARDVPGKNGVLIIGDDTPVFAAETVEFVGDPIAMVAGPDEAEVERILREIEVEYEDLEPVLDMRKSEKVFYEYGYEKGEVDKAFAEADKVYEEILQTGHQEHGYLETQGITVVPLAGGKVKVHGSIQCPYYVRKALVLALGIEPGDIQVIQDVTGGGFGGKEDYPSMIGARVAVTALKAGKPVRVVYDRREDMATTSKRHPTYSVYKAAVKDGKVTAMDIDLLYNAGAYTTISMVVLQRGTICSNGVYNIPHMRAHGRSVKTNSVPNGAFRGFGAPQVFFAVEMFMAHIAKDLGVDPVAFKEAHFVKKGDKTSTNGIFHHGVPLPQMNEKLLTASDYWAKREAYASQPKGRYQRGIGMSYSFHGGGFTGTGERDIIKAVAALQKYPDGKVEILTSGTEMGQGLFTTFAKIVAKELDCPIDQIIVKLPDTDRVPDSGPTVASRSIMVVGELLRRAAAKIKAEWKDGEAQRVEERFQQPEWQIPFNYDTFQGDAYPTFSWGAHCVEIEVDTYTGEQKVIGAWACYDVGTPIDTTVVIGQMEGGFLQGIGYAHMEQMNYDKKGRIRSNSYSDYTMPTAADVPKMEMHLCVEEYPEGPFGAKGAGELPLVGVPGAYVNALEQAIDKDFCHIPVTMEDTLTHWREGGQA
ncbi:MAG: xanthine dehydrogenase family protein molybdopterin-binding subunit [Oscillospiraceae bacterium]|nr:xanthine dehydrogenase family protein molybdopterin-binding subunit [Oscillospiraceae bacterium]